MRREKIHRAPDYTNAALIMGLVNLMWVFIMLKAMFGLPGVFLAAYVLDRLIARMGRRA